MGYVIDFVMFGLFWGAMGALAMVGLQMLVENIGYIFRD
jgi:hypothetical protein